MSVCVYIYELTKSQPECAAICPSTTVQGAQTPYMYGMLNVGCSVKGSILSHFVVASFPQLHDQEFQPTLPNLVRRLWW